MVKSSLQEWRKIFLCNPMFRNQLLREISTKKILLKHFSNLICMHLQTKKEILKQKSKLNSPVNHFLHKKSDSTKIIWVDYFLKEFGFGVLDGVVQKAP